MRRALAAVALCASFAGAQAAGGPVAVEFVDASSRTRCAEEDNVYVRLHAPRIASFRIAAEHPRYLRTVTRDSTAPDFTDCDMSSDPVFRFTPTTVVLHEDATLRIVGHRYETFWRPGAVDVRVGARGEPGLHLVQLVRRGPPRDVEMMVVYPSDGYWRLKPRPPAHLPDTAYGSSFLVGPIDEDGRPYVALRSIDIDVPTMTFRLVFGDGSRGTVRVAAWTRERAELAVTLDPPVSGDRPFAALRSMFVRLDQADASIARWRVGAGERARDPSSKTRPKAEDGRATTTAPIIGFGRFEARGARFGRDVPSRHNLSAPDTIFEGFVAGEGR